MTIPSIGEDMGKLQLLQAIGGNVKCIKPRCKPVCSFFLKVNIPLSYNPAILL